MTAALALLLALACTPAYDSHSWADVDGDCRDTRAEVLDVRCRVAWNPKGCRVKAAVFRDLYTGVELATDSPAQAIHVDHLYPAAEARKRRHWTRTGFSRFFNDAENLVVTRARTNMRENSRMPDRWCPLLGRREMRAWDCGPERLMEAADSSSAADRDHSSPLDGDGTTSS